MTSENIERARSAFALSIQQRVPSTEPRLLSAFSRVARERYLGDPPWTVLPSLDGVALLTDDPTYLYSGARVSLDVAKNINNGDPFFWAEMLSRVCLGPDQHIIQIGAGTGYYTALIADIVGAGGTVSAMEADDYLAIRARHNLIDYPQVQVIGRATTSGNLPRCNCIIAFCGVSTIPPAWLDALSEGGSAFYHLSSLFLTKNRN